MKTRDATLDPETNTHELKEADTCIALGAGVGILGAGAAAATGAVCPLCILIAPGLVGFGAYRRWKASKSKSCKKSDVEL